MVEPVAPRAGELEGNPMRYRTITTLSLLVVGLAAAGCSNSTDGSGTTAPSGGAGSSVGGTTGAGSVPPSAPSTSSTPSTGASSVSSGPPPSSASPTALAAIPVQPQELPADWKASPPSTDTGDGGNAQLTACIGIKGASAKPAAKVEKDYAQGDNEIGSNAQRMKTQADLDADVAALKSPKVNGCYEQILRKKLSAALPAGASLSSVTYRMQPGTNGGPHNVVAVGRGAIVLTSGSQKATFYVENVFIAGPRIEAEIDFEGIGAPIDATLVTTLTGLVAARAAKG